MPELTSLLWYAASAAAITEAVRKTVVNRRVDHEISRDYLAVGLALIAVSFAAGARPTADWLDQRSGTHNLAFLVHGLSAMAAMVCVAGFTRSLGRTALRVRAASGLFLVCASAQIGLFLADGLANPDFGSTAGTSVASRTYTLIYLVYMISWITVFIRSAWQAAQHEVGEVKVGVLLAVIGMVIAASGLAGRLLLTVVGLIIPLHARSWIVVAVVAEASGVLVFAAGSAFAAATRHVHDRRDRARCLRREASVERLWRWLEPVRADIVNFHVGDQTDLRRQLVDILDARLLLRPYVGQGLRDLVAESARVHGLDADSEELAVKAAELRTAINAYQLGIRHQPPTSDVDARPADAAGCANVDDDVDHVAQIADMMTAPVVDDAVRRSVGTR